MTTPRRQRLRRLAPGGFRLSDFHPPVEPSPPETVLRMLADTPAELARLERFAAGIPGVVVGMVVAHADRELQAHPRTPAATIVRKVIDDIRKAEPSL